MGGVHDQPDVLTQEISLGEYNVSMLSAKQSKHAAPKRMYLRRPHPSTQLTMGENAREREPDNCVHGILSLGSVR